MEKYILSKNAQMSTGYHKIHRANCTRKPKDENAIELGECACAIAAQMKARKYFGDNVDGCSYCCKEIKFKE